MIFNEDQQALKEAARKFSRERLSPKYQQREREGRVDRDLVREMGSLGLIGMDMPERYGGMDADAVTTGAIIEELSYGDFNVGALAVVQSLCGAIVARNGSEQIRSSWLARVTRGEAILALSITEPHAGSDAGALRLRAVREGDGYRLFGEKTSTTFSDSADAFLVFARTGPESDAAKAVTAFLVPAAGAGLTSTRFRDVGSHMSGRGSLFFDGVRVPVDNRLGEEGRGFSEVMAGFDYSPSADRAAMHRRGASLDRRGLGLYQRARSLRRPHRPVPGRDLSPGRGRDPTRCGSAARLPHVGAS